MMRENCSKTGPTFGGSAYGPHKDLDIQATFDGQMYVRSCSFGSCYVNDTGQNGRLFFTGKHDRMKINEIEVFEIVPLTSDDGTTPITAQVTQVRTHCAKLACDLENLRQQAEQQSTHLSQVGVDLANLRDGSKKQSTQSCRIETHLAQLDQRTTIHATQLSNVAGELARLQQQAKSQGTHLSKVSGDLASLQQQAKSQGTHLAKVDVDLANLCRFSENQTAHSSRVDADLANLRQLSERHGNQISRVEARVSELSALPTGVGQLVPAQRRAVGDETIRGDKSAILADFNSFLPRFQTKSFRLLWRGSRDGFKAEAFHRRCDGHANTITIIKDTHNNVFGGFTPVVWSARTSPPYEIPDLSGLSFIFAFSKPDTSRPSIFPLRPSEQVRAIFSRSTFGPRFGVADILISNDCNVGGSHTSESGRVYDVSGSSGLLKTPLFVVQEIETFEIVD
jgi:hypothetical protein